MKRFLVFAGANYYPCGGWKDFYGSYDTKDEAQEAIAEQDFDWNEIIDTENLGA